MAYRKDKIAVISIVISVFLFLILSKTVTSGYHFVDDHEVIRIKSDLKSSTLLNVTKVWVKEDLNINSRFRPLYYIHRVFETWLFGSDFILWSIYNGVLCCLFLIFLYLGMRNLKFAQIESIIFLIVTFIGPQSSILWRLGPGESLGMLFLGLSFYFMSKSSGIRNYLANNLLFIFFLILSSLTKESFLIIVPGMILFKIWNEKILLWSSFRESISKNLILIIPIFVFLIELFVIKFHVGIGYSGLDAKPNDLFLSIISTCLHFLKTYLNLAIVGLLLFISALIFKKQLKFNLFAFVFFVLIITPNLFLYAKSGLMERYLLPTAFGLGFLVATFLKDIEENHGWFKRMTLTLVLVSFLPYIVTSFTDAKKFANEGVATKKLFSAISSNNINGSQVMVIVDPVESYETSVSLKTYLFYEDKIDLFGYCLIKENSNESDQGFAEGWKSYFDGRLYENMTSKPGLLIFLDNKIIEKFFKVSNLFQNDYLPLETGDSKFAVLKVKQLN